MLILAVEFVFIFTAIVKPQIVKRGIKVYTGLGRLYRKASLKSDDGKLNKYELERGLLDFHIEIPQSVSFFQFSLFQFFNILLSFI